jgi:hypothetical protein
LPVAPSYLYNFVESYYFVLFNVTATQDYTFSDNLTSSSGSGVTDLIDEAILYDETTSTYLGTDQLSGGSEFSFGVTNSNITLIAGDTYLFGAESFVENVSGSGSGTESATWSASLEPAASSAAPEPTSLAIWSVLGLITAGGYRWRRLR